MVFPEWKRPGWEPYYGRMSILHQPCVGGFGMSIEKDASSVNLRKLVVLERVLWVRHSPVHWLKSGLGLRGRS